jgi:hypothetical protein
MHHRCTPNAIHLGAWSGTIRPDIPPMAKVLQPRWRGVGGGGGSSVWVWGVWAWACGWGLGLGTGDLGLWLNSSRAHHPSMCFGYHNRAKATSNLDTGAVKWKHQTPFGAAFSAGASTRTRTHTPHVHGPSQLTPTAASPTAACSFTSAPTRTSSGHAQSHQHGHSFGSMNQRGP